MHKQRGMTFIGLVLMIAAIVFVAVIGLKLTPAYLEYFSVKSVINKITHQPNFASMSKAQIVDAFNKGADVDNIKVIYGDDLIVFQSKTGMPVVTADYQVTVPLFANISVLLKFLVSSDSKAYETMPKDRASESEDSAE